MDRTLRASCLAWILTLMAGAMSQRAGAEIPTSAGELANRVFVRTAPNGAVELFRMLPGGKFEAGSAYRTNSFTYDRQNLPANQAVLTFSSSDVFSGVPSWRTNRFLLAFDTDSSGQYELQFLINTVPTPQTFAGPFEISAGNNIPPRIWLQPEATSAVLGRSSGVSVGAAGFDLTYQWYLNGNPIPNATRSSHTISTMTADLVGDYVCVVSNTLGTATSQAAKMSLLSAPVITRHPAPTSVFEGDSAILSVEVDGAELHYDWKLNGASLSMGDTPSILFNRVNANQAGIITVTISNNAGSVTSNPSPLSVCATALESTYHDRPWIKILESNDPVPSTASRFGPLASPFNPIFTLWNKTLHAIARGDDIVANPPLPRNALVQWREGTLATLVFTNVPRPDGEPFVYPFYPTDDGAGIVNFTERDGTYSWNNGAISLLIGTNTPVPERPGLHFFGPGSLARRGANLLVASTLHYTDGSDAGTGLYLHDGTSLRRIADGTTDLPGAMTGYAFRTTEDSLNLDETTIVFSTSGSLNGPAGVYRSTYDGTIIKLLDTADLVPGMTNQIINFGDVDVAGDLVFAVVQVKVGNSAQGRVVAFERDGTARLVGNGDYLVASRPRQVLFGNTSSILRWTDGVTEPVINTAAILGCRRITGLFDVEAQGDDIAVGVVFADRSAGIYANFGGADPRAISPRILVHPKDQLVPATTPAFFGVAVNAAGPVSYQWRRNGSPLPRGTNASLSLPSATDTEVGTYDVVVTDGTTSVTSNPAQLSLAAPPALPIVFVPPQSASIPVGSTTSLSVTAAGAPPLRYQWLIGSSPVPIEGATTSTLSTLPTSNSLYRVVISNTSGAITSQVASVSLAPIIVQQPQPITTAAGRTATFTVQATGFEQYRYIWLKDNVAVPGGTNATFTLGPVSAADAGEYSVLVLAIGGGSLRSDRVQLKIEGSDGGPEPTPVTLQGARLENGQLRFEFSSINGWSYIVESAPQPISGVWTEIQRIAGDGATQVVRLDALAASGFARLRSVRP